MSEALLTLDAILQKLSGVKQAGDNYRARCPAHDDSTASLSVSSKPNGQILFKCFAGCTFHAIINALNLTAAAVTPPSRSGTSRPFPAFICDYLYRDLSGRVVFRVVRYDDHGKKTFRQCRPDGAGGWSWQMRGVQKVPYRYNELRGHHTIYVVEGEKDADTLWQRKLPATTNAGGASKWTTAETFALRDIGIQKCILLPDNDPPGRKHMQDVEQHLRAAGIAAVNVSLLGLTAKQDITDWFGLGHTIAELEELAGKTPFLVPTGATLIQEPSADPDPHGASRWELTDAGAAEAFAHRYRDTVRYDHRHDRWLIWDQHYWAPDMVRHIEQLAKSHFREWRKEAIDIRDTDTREQVQGYARRCENRSRLEAILKSARPIEDIRTRGDEWDREKFLLGCPNGVLDLQTGSFRAGLPSDYLTFQTGAVYEPTATAPAWDKFLCEIFDRDPEVIGFVQRAVGFSLTGAMEPAVFFMCVGHGSNGKSTFLNAIDHVWGRYAYTTSMTTFTTSDKGSENDFNLAELDGPRLIIASEAKIESRLNEQLLKNYTGGEKVNAQRKHGRPFEFQPRGKIWMGLNHQPTVKDDSHGFWRRMQVISFPRTFSGSDIDLKLAEKLRAEAPGILSWAVRGALAWQQRGLDPPLSIQMKVEEYKDEEDPNREFLIECLDTADSTCEESITDLYLSYEAYCQRVGRRFTQSRKSFGRYLSKFLQKRESHGKTYYLGVRIKFRSQERLYQ